MAGNLEIEKMRHPLPIPRDFKEQLVLDKRKDRILVRQIRKINFKKSLEEKIVTKNPYGLLLFRNIALTPDEVAEFKITRDEIEREI